MSFSVKSIANSYSDAEQELHSYSDKASERLEALYLSGKFTEANPTLAEVSQFSFISNRNNREISKLKQISVI